MYRQLYHVISQCKLNIIFVLHQTTQRKTKYVDINNIRNEQKSPSKYTFYVTAHHRLLTFKIQTFRNSNLNESKKGLKGLNYCKYTIPPPLQVRIVPTYI